MTPPADVFVFSTSFAQRRIWLLDRLSPGNAAYNIPAAVRFLGPFDVVALEQAVAAVVARHESLRTTILLIDDEPRQVVASQQAVTLRIVDGVSWDPEWLRREMEAETQRPFDLAVGPLLRVTVYRFGVRNHVVQITIHHAVADGWSMGVLVGEINVAFEAIVAGREPAFTPLAIQYGDFAEWQREWLAGGERDRLLDYWRRHLAAPRTSIELPTDRPRPPAQTFGGASVRFAVAPALTTVLGQLARQEGATLFMVLLAAYKALLFRYTAEEDVIVGAPIANRTRVELEPLIGCFVNTLVLRTRVRGDRAFRALLRNVRRTTLDAYAHQDLPFEQLVEALQPERNLGHTPLFQTLFSLQNTPSVGATAGAATIEPLELDACTAKFDLSVSLTEVDGGLKGSAEYNTDLFDHSTVDRFVSHFLAVMAGIAADADQQVRHLPLLSSQERRQFDGWNATAVDFAGPATIHEAVAAQARRTPDAIAVVFEGATLTYAELDGRANRLANLLRQHGVSAETIVGVSLERSFDLVVALLAVLKAGGAYLPLDPAYPVRRLATAIEDASVGHILTTRALVETLAFDRSKALCLDELNAQIAMAPSGSPESRVHPEQAAYIMFTSGSTGRPKGAVNSHRAVMNRLRWQVETFGMTGADRVLQKTPFSFDVSVPELFTPLMVGGCLVVATPGLHRDPRALVDIVERQQITIATFVPSMLRPFLEVPRPTRHPSLRLVLSAGEAMPSDLPRLFFACCDAELVNVYGPTEAAIDVTYFRCDPAVPRSPVPIGAPISNATIHVVDETFALAPVGVAGEVMIGGTPLARCYVSRPDQTALRFIPDPFGPPGARMYRTGDRARRLADGTIEFLGRFDHQIKLRGHRLEAGEIEVQLRDQPGVADAVVVLRGDDNAEPRLVAYVVPGPGGRIHDSLLRERLASTLPSFMVPSLFVQVPALPRLPNGKVDRSALPAPPTDGTGLPVAPRTATEEIVLGIWRELLRAESIGVMDDFFALGGHSLLATQVVARIAQTFGTELSLRTVFEQPTVAALAATLDAARQESGDTAAPPVERVARDEALPLSFAQMRIWFLSQMEGASRAYNMPIALRLRGRLDVAILERSLQALVARHEVLRSRVVVTAGRPTLVIDSSAVPHLRVEDLRDHAPADRERLVTERLVAEFDRHVDLARSPLLWATLLVADTDEHILVLTTHHFASDGWSTRLLSEEVVRLYAAFSEGRPSPLDPLPIQYADFAAWQRRWLTGPALERQRAYWHRQLRDAPPMSTPTPDRPRPPVQTFRGDACSFTLGPDVSAALHRFNRQTGSTVFISLLAAFAALLGRWTRQEDLVVGTPTAARGRREFEPVVGCFLNMFALRADLSGNPSFRELVARVRDVTLDAAAHQDLPFEQVVDVVDPVRSTSITPLFQVVFSTTVPEATAMELSRLRVEPLPPARRVAKFDLMVGVADHRGEIAGTFEYNADLFERDTIAQIADEYGALVEALLSQPETRLSELGRPTGERRARLLALGAGAAPTTLGGLLPDRLVTTTAQRASDTAVVDHGGSISWSALDSDSDALAHRLKDSGVGRGDRVAVLLPRSARAVVAYLAVMKSGAAYVPLDPTYPIERLRFMVDDSGARLLLTAQGTDDRFLGVATLAVDGAPGVETVPFVKPGVRGEDLAYVIYTSGSSGRPKGVEVTQAALRNLIDWHVSTFGVTARDRVSHVASPAFDASVWEIWPALAARATLCIADGATLRSPSQLVQWLTAQRVSLAFVPTPLAERLVDVDWSGSALRMLLTGGDRLHAGLAERLPFPLVNNYGPTEGTVVTTSVLVQRSATPTTPSIGRPIDGARVYLVDDRLDLVSAGAVGELLIGGTSLANGYHGQPGQTAERFVPDPFSGVNGGRLYRTGDLARWRPDGTLAFLGRGDRQVSVRGFRIELGEIESVLLEHPQVTAAVAIPRGSGPDTTLTAYVASGASLDHATLQAWLGARLPAFSVPSTITVLADLPLTPGGKVDLRALPQLARPAEHVAPVTALERTVAAIWQRVLGVDRVGVTENFFDLGGHSLALVTVHDELEKSLGREVSMVELFQFPTVATLAARLAAEGGSPGRDDVLRAAEARGARQRASWSRGPHGQGMSEAPPG